MIQNDVNVARLHLTPNTLTTQTKKGILIANNRPHFCPFWTLGT